MDSRRGVALALAALLLVLSPNLSSARPGPRRADTIVSVAEYDLQKHHPELGCRDGECGIVEKCFGKKCWEITCPPCKDSATGVFDLATDLALGKKDGKWNCTAAQCGTNQTKCITVPVVGDICWNVTCPACGGDDKEVAGPVFLLDEELAKDGKGKKHYGCTPEDCGTTKDVCITVPVKGEVCWKVKCPACPDAGEPTMLSLLDMGKKDGKWNCTAAQCGTNQTKCINIPVVGDICWNVTCPACGGDDKEVAGPAFLLEEELAKDGKGKKHFGCTPEDCGTTKDVCITVPVKGEVCWKVKCPACPDAGEPTMLSLLDMGKKDGKWNCTAAQCGTNQTKCINIPVVGDVCWNVTCPACGGDDKEVAGPAFLLEELAKDGKGKKHYGCTPEYCGTTKDVCITVPVKGEVCWKVKCPACPVTKGDIATDYMSYL